jgi:glutamyl-tRNA reductase
MEHAHDLARRYDARAVALDAAMELLPSVDILITAATVEEPLFTRAEMLRVLEKRCGRPLLLVDLAVPRNVESSVGELEGVRLVNLDELGPVTRRNRKHRLVAASRCEELVRDYARRYVLPASVMRCEETEALV